MAKRDWNKTIKEWKRRTDGLRGADKIQAAYEISKEANQLATTHDPQAVQAAIRQLMNEDRKQGAAMLRLSEYFGNAEIKQAKQHFMHGSSLTHLMLLTQVSDAGTRKQLFDQSLKEQWSEASLRQAVTGKSGLNVSIRPTQVVTSVVRTADKLLGLLNRLDNEFASGMDKVKQSDRKRAKDQMKTARSRIQSLSSALKQAEKALERAGKAIG